MFRRTPGRLRFRLRSLLVGVTAAAIAVGIVSWFGLSSEEVVIIVAAVVAVLIEAAIHRRGLRWFSKDRNRPRVRRRRS